MADVEPLRALHYDLARVGSLDDVLAPPYDVLDPVQRAALAGRSPYNVVALDVPEGRDPYAHAAALLAAWQRDGALVRDAQPALWLLEQDVELLDGSRGQRRGLLARVRLDADGGVRIRPHERTHPEAVEDRLRLTRATQANLSPILLLHADPEAQVAKAMDDARPPVPWGTADGLRLWRVGDPEAIGAVQARLEGAELLIADGHHRYETARRHAEAIGGEGPQRYVLACLVAAEDPGLVIRATHRLVRADAHHRAALERTLAAHFDVEPAPAGQPAPHPGTFSCVLVERGGRSRRLRLRDRSLLEALPAPQRPVDAAVLDELLLRGPLGLTEQDPRHHRRLDYAPEVDAAREALRAGAADLAFLLAPASVAQVLDVARAGLSMPPKSTSFAPKVPAGLLFSPLR